MEWTVVRHRSSLCHIGLHYLFALCFLSCICDIGCCQAAVEYRTLNMANHQPQSLPGVSFDEMLRKLPRMFDMAQDMHNMTEYIGQMRIICILMMVVGVIGGVIFLILKSRKDRSQRGKVKYQRCGDVDESVDSTVSRLSDHLYPKQVPAPPPRSLPKDNAIGGFQPSHKMKVLNDNNV